MTISRQLGVVIGAFAVAMPGAVLCLSYSLSEAAADARRASVEGNRQTSALFALTDTVPGPGGCPAPGSGEGPGCDGEADRAG